MGEKQAVGVRVQGDPSAAAHAKAQQAEVAGDGGATDESTAAPAEVVTGEGVTEDAASAGGAEGAADGAPEGDGGLPSELDELVAKASERDEYLALAQRTQADFENYRKRVARDAASAENRGLARLARELLPALDNLDRALAASGDAGEALVEGLLLVQRELLGALERAGIESYGAVGEQFDPEVHEAVAQQPFEDRQPGEIGEVYQSGYRLAGGVIRPARVLVAG